MQSSRGSRERGGYPRHPKESGSGCSVQAKVASFPLWTHPCPSSTHSLDSDHMALHPDQVHTGPLSRPAVPFNLSASSSAQSPQVTSSDKHTHPWRGSALSPSFRAQLQQRRRKHALDFGPLGTAEGRNSGLSGVPSLSTPVPAWRTAFKTCQLRGCLLHAEKLTGDLGTKQNGGPISSTASYLVASRKGCQEPPGSPTPF